MEALWFALAAVMVAIYVVMDGFDFGAGLLPPGVAKTDRERRQVLAAIGPFWDGNEVWLLAAGGVLFLAFPKVLAAGLSGFYLAIYLLLWVLILALFGGCAAWFGGNLPPTLRARVLSVQAMIAVAFLAFLLFTSNPFLRLAAPPFDGHAGPQRHHGDAGIKPKREAKMQREEAPLQPGHRSQAQSRHPAAAQPAAADGIWRAVAPASPRTQD